MIQEFSKVFNGKFILEELKPESHNNYSIIKYIPIAFADTKDELVNYLKQVLKVCDDDIYNKYKIYFNYSNTNPSSIKITSFNPPAFLKVNYDFDALNKTIDKLVKDSLHYKCQMDGNYLVIYTTDEYLLSFFRNWDQGINDDDAKYLGLVENNLMTFNLSNHIAYIKYKMNKDDEEEFKQSLFLLNIDESQNKIIFNMKDIY